MADVFSEEKRSKIMSKIRAKDTKPEIKVRTYLHNRGLRYRLHDRSLPGKPDLKLPKYNTVVNVHGCFWHGHQDCDLFRLPKSNVEYWKDKIEGNRERDKKNKRKLKEAGWNVITIWECEIKHANPEERLEELYQEIIKNK